MNEFPPVNWRTRRNTGAAQTLHASTINGTVRVGARGIRLILSRDAALALADDLVDAVESLDQPHTCAFTFAEQLEQAIAAAADSETRTA